MVGKKSVNTTVKVAQVLRAMSSPSPGGYRLSDIAEATGLGKTNVHRLLASLCEVGFVERDAHSRRYRLGNELAALGLSAYGANLTDSSRPILLSLARQTEDTVYLHVRSGFESLCLDRAEGQFPIKVLVSDKGDRRPLGIGAGGLAILAYLEDSEIEQILASNEPMLDAYENYSVDILWSLIAETRARKYALNDGMVISGMSAVGVPVFDASGSIRAALSIAAITTRLTGARRQELVELLQESATRLSDLMSPK